jgi:hypothetical protein
MERLASIYERKDALFIAADHRTRAGFWIADELVVTLCNPTPAALGNEVLMALGRSRDGVPTPPPSARIDKPLLAAAGVGSWRTFMTLSKHVSVSINDGVLKVAPYRNLGSKGGFEPQPDLDFECSEAVLGEAVIEALRKTP